MSSFVFRPFFNPLLKFNFPFLLSFLWLLKCPFWTIFEMLFKPHQPGGLICMGYAWGYPFKYPYAFTNVFFLIVFLLKKSNFALLQLLYGLTLIHGHRGQVNPAGRSLFEV